MYCNQNKLSTGLKPRTLELWSVSDKKVSLMITQQDFSKGRHVLISVTARSLIRSALSQSGSCCHTICNIPNSLADKRYFQHKINSVWSDCLDAMLNQLFNRKTLYWVRKQYDDFVWIQILSCSGFKDCSFDRFDWGISVSDGIFVTPNDIFFTNWMWSVLTVNKFEG